MRQDDRVVNLERTNIADLTMELVPDVIDLVTLDLGFLALAHGVPQIEVLSFSPDAELLALVKPMAELGLGAPPETDEELREACSRARLGVEAAGWSVINQSESSIRGARGAREFFLYARRAAR